MSATPGQDYTLRLAQKLIAIAQIWRRAIARALCDEGISDAMVLPLVHLMRDGDGIRQGTLAERVGVDNTSIVRVLDGLERSGLILRSEDASDRRAKLVHLTDAGRDMALGAERTLTRIRGQLLQGCARADVEAMDRVLNAMLAAIAEGRVEGADASSAVASPASGPRDDTAPASGA